MDISDKYGIPPKEAFAEEYQRRLQDNIQTDWVVFPVDATYRKSMFHPDVMAHPAKANIYMMQEIWRHVSQPGQTIMDFFGGVGTTILATLEDRNVILCELEPAYIKLQRESITKLSEITGVDVAARVLILEGDNRRTIPTARREAFLKWGSPNIHHIMGSPPYAGILIADPKAESTRYLLGTTYAENIKVYTDHKDSLGKLPKFRYNMEMTKVYRACFDILMPGGTLTTIMKDYMRGGSRVYLSKWFSQVCTGPKVGWKEGQHFEEVQWLKRYSPGTGFLRLHASRGFEVVRDEDIVIYGKPKV